MIEKILTNLVNEYAGQAITGNASIPNDQKRLISQALPEALFSGVKDQISQGNVAGMLDIFSSQKTTSTGNTVMNGIESTVTTILCQKTGLNKTIVQGLVSAVIPAILSALGKKAGDPKDNSLDFNDILKSFGGGGIDLNSLMGRLNDENDAFDMNDIIKTVSGLAGQKGGVMGMLGGLFGK